MFRRILPFPLGPVVAAAAAGPSVVVPVYTS
jgi:hypothetical protein